MWWGLEVFPLLLKSLKFLNHLKFSWISQAQLFLMYPCVSSAGDLSGGSGPESVLWRAFREELGQVQGVGGVLHPAYPD